MSKRVVRLVDRRACAGGMVRELRSIIRGIESGDIVSTATVVIRRDGTMSTRFDCECLIRTLGSVELLKEYIKHKKFELIT